jgi:Na+/H+-dicarboxylate symporter
VPDLVIPFGIFANQHGAVFLLSFLTMFLSQIYVINLGVQDYVLISIGSIIAGATAVGGGAVLIPTVTPVLAAVGIPTPLALVVLATTDNLIGPVRTVLTLQSNITLTVLTARSGKEMPATEPQDGDVEPQIP